MNPPSTAPTPGRPTRLSLVLPARNERNGIEPMLAEIARTLQGGDVVWEAVVVDDGSTDGTFEVLRKLAKDHPQLRGVRLSRNYGKEAALLAGLTEATGDVVVTMDSDLQHPPALVPEMLARWRAGARVVHAVKRAPSDPHLLHRLASVTFNRLSRAMSGLDMDGASDFTLLDRTVVDVMVRDLPESRRFYRGLTRWVGFRQERVDFDVAPRAGGSTRWSFRGLVGLALTGLLSFSSLPLRLVTILGFLTLAFAVAVAAETLWSSFQGLSVSGFATIEITLLFLGSSIMISLGIMGEYVGRIYDEIKRRPGYLVAERFGPDDAAR